MGKHYQQFDLDDRIELSRLYEAGTARSEIARIMGRHPSTIGRELERNSLPRAGYKPGRGGPHGVHATATKVEDRAPEPTRRSRPRPPCDGLVARADRRQAQTDGS